MQSLEGIYQTAYTAKDVTAAQAQTSGFVVASIPLPPGAIVVGFKAWADGPLSAADEITIDISTTKYTNDRTGGTSVTTIVEQNQTSFRNSGDLISVWGDADADEPHVFLHGGSIDYTIDTAAATGTANKFRVIVYYGVHDMTGEPEPS